MKLLRRKPDPIATFTRTLGAEEALEAFTVVPREYRRLFQVGRGRSTQGWELLRHGSRCALFSPTLNRLLPAVDVPIELSGERYEVPQELRPYAGQVLRERARRSRIFNGEKLRLMSDLNVDLVAAGAPLRLQPTDFFSTLITNDVAAGVLHDGERTLFNGFRLLAADDHHLFDLAESPCSNHVGVSAVAITADEQLVILEQAADAATYGGQLMPAGSGALDPVDLEAGETMQPVLRAAFTRIVQDECGVGPEMIGETGAIGFMRQIDRGGKPEFFGLVYLTCKLAELDVNPSAFVQGARSVDLFGVPVSQLRDVLELFRSAEEHKLSFSLYAALAFLEHHLAGR